jgi:hypothetical protein
MMNIFSTRLRRRCLFLDDGNTWSWHLRIDQNILQRSGVHCATCKTSVIPQTCCVNRSEYNSEYGHTSGLVHTLQSCTKRIFVGVIDIKMHFLRTFEWCDDPSVIVSHVRILIYPIRINARHFILSLQIERMHSSSLLGLAVVAMICIVSLRAAEVHNGKELLLNLCLVLFCF